MSFHALKITQPTPEPRSSQLIFALPARSLSNSHHGLDGLSLVAVLLIEWLTVAQHDLGRMLVVLFDPLELCI
jgi:hypothetical protein